MLSVKENVSLKPFNTFHLQAVAKYFVTVSTIDEVKELIQSDLFKNNRSVILGGGSNVLLNADFPGLIIKNEIKGIHTVEENDHSIVLNIGSGENWHSFVLYCVDHNWGGVENLSLIPGTVGAAPMQNIGAYGVEIKDVLISVEALRLSDGTTKVLTNEECLFGYRESIFKHQFKNQYFISSITLRLTKINHTFKTNYGAIQEVLKNNGTVSITVKAISDAVIAIRKSKLPDPDVIGNAGSFFKNPSIDAEKHDSLKKLYPDIPSFPGEHGLIKIPAAWLIEQCGWKGKTFGAIGVHKNQALVLVNYGGGKGEDIWKLAINIRESVHEKFGVELHPEVNMIN